MSARFADRTFTQICENFPDYIDKVAIYTRDTKEKKKKDLIDPNASWSDKRIIIHSATIEAGVDVTIPFNKQYCQIQSGRFLPSQRSLFQMLGRFRNVTDNENLTYYNPKGMKISINANYFTIDDVYQYILLCQNICQDVFADENAYGEYDASYHISRILSEKITTIDECENDQLSIRHDISVLELYDKILVHNQCEEWNKNNSVWFSVFYSLLRSKGHEISMKESDTINSNTYSDDGDTEALETLSNTTKNTQTLTSADMRGQQKEEIIKRWSEMRTTFDLESEILDKRSKLTEEEQDIKDRYFSMSV